MIGNPVLPGFHPDPSICRVGADYYIATSTFEWYPGVRIYQSTDLANWRLVATPLNREDLLDLRGVPDGGGVWAPCLSHADGQFWLVYTDVRRLDGAFKDAHNYITTCRTIDGVWSPRRHVTSSGFDPSLFHDEDGRKWFLNMRWNHRGRGTGLNPAQDSFDGIEVQQWHPDHGLCGPVRTIFTGTDLGLTEAPHLFRRDGWLYLTTAEGGTGYDHAVTMARARRIEGPYEVHPQKHLMTARFAPDSPIQRVGHGQYVETPDGVPYHSFLMGRPLPGTRVCPMGRETGLARCVWRDDGWLYLAGGGLVPPVRLPGPPGAGSPPATARVQVFDGPTLPSEFQWLRSPRPDRLFTLTGGALRLFGRESLGSWFEQSLVARRQDHSRYTADTLTDADPATWQQAAGLITYYNRHKFHAALLTRENGRRVLTLVSCLGDWPGEALSFFGPPVPVPDGPIRLGVRVDGDTQQFFCGVAGGDSTPVGPALDARLISDEAGRGEHASFTGAFVGMVAYDLTGQGWSADFRHFAYHPCAADAAIADR